MNNRTNIYFIGRKQGVGFRHFRISHLENRRKYESEGLEDATDAVLSVNGKHESQIYVASVDGILRTYDIRNCQRIEDHFQSIISHVGL